MLFFIFLLVLVYTLTWSTCREKITASLCLPEAPMLVVAALDRMDKLHKLSLPKLGVHTHMKAANTCSSLWKVWEKINHPSLYTGSTNAGCGHPRSNRAQTCTCIAPNLVCTLYVFIVLIQIFTCCSNNNLTVLCTRWIFQSICFHVWFLWTATFGRSCLGM